MNFSNHISCFAYEYLKSSLEKSHSIYKLELSKCIDELSEEAVHDFRVCVRRFIALIQLINDALPNNYYKEFEYALSSQIKRFSALRDVQVQILNMGQMIFQFPVLYTFYNDLLRKEKALVADLRKAVMRFDDDGIDSLIFFLTLYMNQKALSGKIPQNSLMSSGRKTYMDLKTALKIASAGNPALIHKARLAFKKFRYAMEILKPFTGISESDIGRMKAFQSVMGEIQDSRALQRNLLCFIGRQKIIPREAYAPALDFFYEEMNNLINEFMKISEENDTFGFVF